MDISGMRKEFSLFKNGLRKEIFGVCSESKKGDSLKVEFAI